MNKLCNVAFCWIYIGILLGAHCILHISRIRIKSVDWSYPVLCESVAGFIECVSVNWIYLFVCEDKVWIFLGGEGGCYGRALAL
jgi:hypothetical protein